MIRAYIFDLDGTLVKTERLKAISYAKAAVELRPELAQDEIIEGFKQVVGRSRKDVAEYLVHTYQLQKPASKRRDEFGVSTAWQAYVQIRLKYYRSMIEDPQVIRANRWPHTLELVELARSQGCNLALATMSRCQQANQVLSALGLDNTFDFVATRDDVERGKPDPEIYHLVLSELNMTPEQCLAIEDSPSGIEAALAAGVQVVAIATPFTRQSLHELRLLPESHIANGPDEMPEVVKHVISHLD